MNDKILICVPHSLPDLLYGGPAISSESLRNILQSKLNLFCRILSFKDTSNFGSCPAHTFKGNSLFQLAYLSYFIFRFHRDRKIIILNSFFHIQTALLYLFVMLLSLVVDRSNLLLVVAPRAELMYRGQPNTTLKARVKKLYFTLFLCIENVFRFRTTLAFTSNQEFIKTSYKYKISITKNNIKSVILPNIPNDILPLHPGDSTLDTVYSEKLSSFWVSRTISLCFLGRISVEKGLLELMRHLACLAHSKLKIQLDLYGPINREYKCLIDHEMLIYPNCYFQFAFKGLTTRDQLFTVLNKYLFAIFPSKGENYCHSIAECLSIGLPVIYTNIPHWDKYCTPLHSLKSNIAPLFNYGESFHSLDQYLEDINQYTTLNYTKISNKARKVFEFDRADSSLKVVKLIKSL